MFQSEKLDNHLKRSDTVQTESVVFAEWNLNDGDNIERLGNYRYRPNTEGSKFSLLPSTYDPIDVGGYYTGATNADITIQSGLDDQDNPTLFTTRNEKMNLLYSLEDCVKHNRPRSGINKLLYLGETANQYLDIAGQDDSIQETLDIARRPRYYMASRKDPFKYWTSYRTEELNGEQQEFGVSQNSNTGIYYIDDAVPFVVYKDDVPTNKIVVKMQTNVGDIDLGPFRYDDESIADPLFGQSNQTTPEKWSIQILKGNDWITAASFDRNSEIINGEPIIKSDGYVEISYGLQLPFQYQDAYVYAGELSHESLLPDQAPYGYTFLIKENEDDLGILKLYDGQGWKDIVPEYSWGLSSQQVDIRTPKVTKLSDPDYFIDEAGQTIFREFEFIRGIRVIVERMNIPDCTFDLIEFSPRLVADISNKVSNLSITKTMSDLGNGSIPVGSVLASTGSMSLFDEDFSFNSNYYFEPQTNTGSIIANYLDMRIKFNIYQVIKNVDNYDYFIPQKVLYTDEIPKQDGQTATVEVVLRDLFFLLEYSKAPEILITDVSLSYAVTLLLDSIGFSNCVFKRISGKPEMIIPFFFIGPEQNVAEVLQQLAIASQSAMFFDEYNNFVVMSKEYLLPEVSDRETDSFLYGQREGESLPNIIGLSSQEKKVFNEGRIDYTTRYIQREISEYRQANYSDRYKTYGYKPALLWEIAGRTNLRTKNDLESESQGFTLTAAPLNSNLSNVVPSVKNNQIVDNVIDLGENIDLGVASHQGYFYANGEIIRYDAIEYAIIGNLDDGQSGNFRWVTSNQEYQKYFSQLPFNGKMYPTGNVRIYAEPEYEKFNGQTRMKNGPVKKHGRGQFGTPVVQHNAGLDPYWSDNENVYGCLQESKDYLFNTNEYIEYPDTVVGEAGKESEDVPGLTFFNSDEFSVNSTRNGVIKNFRANKYYSEEEVNSFSTARVGTVQSSALVFNGPETPLGMQPSNFISYVAKNLFAGGYEEDPRSLKRYFIIKYNDGFSPLPLINNRYPQATEPSRENIELILFQQEAGSTGFPELAEGEYRLVSDQTNDIAYSESFVDAILQEISEDPAVEYIKRDREIFTGGTAGTTPGRYSHFGTRMRIIGKIESTNQKSATPYGAFPFYETSDLDIDDPEKNIKILGGSGGIAFNLNKETNNGYYFEIASLSQDNIEQYVSDSKPVTVSYAILDDPAPSCVDNVVTVTANRNIDFSVGQRILISGLVDSLNPADTRTPLNGEFEITAINEDGKRFQYTIPGDPIDDRTSVTGGVAQIVQPSQNNIANVFFYKILADSNGKAIPIRLWSGTANIIADDGKFTGQYRFTGEENSTVFDLSAEYVNQGTSKVFYLYLNNKQIATVTDTDPLPEYNNMALFVRGSSRCMFENIYALGANITQNNSVALTQPLSNIWGDDEIDSSEALRKYALSGIIQKTYLSGVNSEGPTSHLLYYDEFGTIMREAVYLNVKYDRAFPALYARIMKTFNRLKGYVVSGFYAGSYGADFLIFNSLDSNLNLDDTTGNFLRIQGITFTQNTTKSITVDDYYAKASNFSDPLILDDGVIKDPNIEKEEYNRILNSRIKYGVNEFNIASNYIQTDDVAEEILGWTIEKVAKPKTLIGVNSFGTHNLQLGDIVQINYKNNDGFDVISSPQTRFVIYNIEYSKSAGEETMTMYLAEV